MRYMNYTYKVWESLVKKLEKNGNTNNRTMESVPVFKSKSQFGTYIAKKLNCDILKNGEKGFIQESLSSQILRR